MSSCRAWRNVAIASAIGGISVVSLLTLIRVRWEGWRVVSGSALTQYPGPDSYETGWYLDADGERMTFRQKLLSPNRAYEDELMATIDAGRPHQCTTYLEYAIGFPIGYLQCFQRATGKYGEMTVIRNGREELPLVCSNERSEPPVGSPDLCVEFPERIYGAIGLAGLCANFFLWSVLVLAIQVFCVAISRRRCNLTKSAHCINCGYDLRGASSRECSECGREF